VNEWSAALGLGTQAFATAVPVQGLPPFGATVTSWSVDPGPGLGLGKMQVLGVLDLGELWPHEGVLGQEALLTIFQFFDSFGP
jgi:hypothetical protein